MSPGYDPSIGQHIGREHVPTEGEIGENTRAFISQHKCRFCERPATSMGIDPAAKVDWDPSQVVALCPDHGGPMCDDHR